MKLRPILVLLLFVVSAGVLVWLYYAATREPASGRTAPWTETIADLDACSRRKHVKSIQYDHFAAIADEEDRPETARLFRAMAASERLQGNNCINALTRLGGHYSPPEKVVIFRGTTDSNLARSIDFERRTIGERHGAEIGRALERGNRYAARVLIWAAAGDMRHILLMERCRDKASGDEYAVCPVCGNLYDTTYSDPYCPHCLTAGPDFIRFR